MGITEETGIMEVTDSMGNYVEGNDRIAFHPGYYVEEILEDSGLTHEDFAKRLGVTPESLSLLVRGEQRLSVEMAGKLSDMLGTGIEYWVNLQNSYDAVLAGIGCELGESGLDMQD